MDFSAVSRTSDTWPYQQVAAVILDAIRTGELRPGDRLPSVTRIAQEAGVSRQTVQNALGLLRAEGAVYTVARLGTFAGPHPGT